MPGIMKITGKDLESPDQRQEYTICVVGCGRTGLVTACLFLRAGFKVVGVDTSSHIVHQLKKGKSPFSENDLRKLIEPCIKNSQFKATTTIRTAVSESDTIIIAVPSALDKKKKPDYTHLEKTCREIGMSLNTGSLIIIQNNMAPGTTQTLVKETLENASGLKVGTDFGLAYSSTLNGSMNPANNVINGTKVVGGITKRSLKVTCLLLGTITKGEIIRVKDIKVAEAVKLLEEAYKDVNIAFANEFAQFCEKAKIDFVKVWNIINPLKFSGMAGLHMSKDSFVLVEEAEALDVKLRLLSLSTKINDETLDHTVRLIRDALRASQKNLRRAKVSVFGISAIADRKKVSNSAAKKLVQELKKRGVLVKVFDPLFSHKELLSLGYDTETSLSSTVEGADCLVIAVAHDRFRRINLNRLQMLMKQPAALVDMGQIVDPVKAEKAGFIYRGFGRGVWTS